MNIPVGVVNHVRQVELELPRVQALVRTGPLCQLSIHKWIPIQSGISREVVCALCFVMKITPKLYIHTCCILAGNSKTYHHIAVFCIYLICCQVLFFPPLGW